MNMDERIKRINELYHKSVSVGLSEEEKAEQTILRKEYIQSVRGSLKSQLNNIDIKEADGSITNLGEKFSAKEETLSGDNSLGNIRTRKSIIRKETMNKRSLIKPSEVIDKSKIICSKIAQMPEYINAGTILMYYPYNNEAETFELFEKALADGKRVAFPKTELIDGHADLEFYEINSLEQFENGYKGIMEPDYKKFSLTKFEGEADLCIAPGVAFDKKGARIGYGKGFYDRYLGKHKCKFVIGIGFELQISEEIPLETDDIKMNVVVTEKNIYR